jgi:hypothetical protein
MCAAPSAPLRAITMANAAPFCTCRVPLAAIQGPLAAFPMCASREWCRVRTSTGRRLRHSEARADLAPRERTKVTLPLRGSGDALQQGDVALVGSRAVYGERSEQARPDLFEDNCHGPPIRAEATPLAGDVWPVQPAPRAASRRFWISHPRGGVRVQQDRFVRNHLALNELRRGALECFLVLGELK